MLRQHDNFRREFGDDEVLHPAIKKRIGFSTAKKVMREIMLQDTVERLPKVLSMFRRDLDECEREEKSLLEKQKFSDPVKLRLFVHEVMIELEKKILGYLNGDLSSTIKFPNLQQTLFDELEEEEMSDWSRKELNHYTEKEDEWRIRISELENFPEEAHSNEEYHGGKQVQRALEFFRIVMIEAIPNPFELKHAVPNITGYLSQGLKHENWEHAMVQIVKVCLGDMTHPGINFLVKHIGNIFRRLFGIAMDDIKQGHKMSAVIKLLPPSVEKFMASEYDAMLWELMESAAQQTNLSLAPMYSTVNPNLPTFHSYRIRNDGEANAEPIYVKGPDGEFTEHKPQESSNQEWYVKKLADKFKALVSGSASEAKKFLKQENRDRASRKKCFLPDERTTMITKDETEKILQRSHEYIVALMEFVLVNVEFFTNHFLYEQFKIALQTSFTQSLVHRNELDTIVEEDPFVEERLKELKDEIKRIRDLLQRVQRLSRQL